MSTPTPEESRDYFRSCNICKKQIAYGATYYKCSVSTCNTKRFPFHLCSLDCFSAHAPEARHRDAWAEEERAPSKEQDARDRTEAAALDERKATARIVGVGAQPQGLNAQAPKDVLIVVSKLKAYVKARSEMNTADNVIEELSDQVRALCDRAIEKARESGRKTVMDRDFQK